VETKRKGGLFSRLMDAISRSSAVEVVALQEETHLRGQKVAVPFKGLPIQLVLGPKDGRHKKLHLYPDRPLCVANSYSCSNGCLKKTIAVRNPGKIAEFCA